MIVLSGTFTWRIGKIPALDCDIAKVFAWLATASPLRPGVTSVSFSYSKGWSIETVVPLDRTAKEIDELQRKTLSMLGIVPLRAEDGLQVVDFVLPPEAPEVTS